MTTKIKAGFDPAIPLEKIHQHPKNPRRNATASDELVASVKAQGLMQALVVAPHPEIAGEYVLIAGHRRRDALTRAGAKTAKAEIRDDLVTEVQQIESMLIENSARADLTAIEEAEAYEQLQLFNLKPADIAKAVGKSRQTVTSRLKLLTLGEQARSKVHDGQVTIDDALALAELPKAVRDQVESSLGTAHFRTELTRQRERAAKVERFKADQKAAEELGIPAYADEPVDVWNLHRKGEVLHIAWLRATDSKIIEIKDKHAECLRWFHYVEITGTPVVSFGCVDPDSHVDENASPTTSVDAEREEREAHFAELRAQAEKEAEDRAVAARLRWETLAAAKPADVVRGTLPLFLSTIELWDRKAIVEVTGIERIDGYLSPDHEAYAELATWLGKASDDDVLRTIVALLADTLQGTAERMDEDPLVVAAFDGLRGLGHQFTDVDVAQEAAALGHDPEAGDE